MSRHASHAIATLGLVFLVLGVARGVPATPSSAWFYRAWQTEDGLPDNSVTGVGQGRDGYLWVGTKGGLLRFNGDEFAAIPQANLPVLPSRTVRAMLVDHHDQVWLGMERGPILCVKPDGLGILTVTNGLINLRVLCLAEDREGAVWVVYPNDLRRIQNGQVSSVKLPATWPAGAGCLIARDSRGEMWLARGSDLGVFRDGEIRVVTRLDEPVAGLCADVQSGLWLCLGDRLLKFEEGHAPVERGRLPGHAMPLALIEDHAGALWIGTVADGLFRLAGNRLESIPTSHHEITCLKEDHEGNIWAGTTGGGLNLVRSRAVELIDRAAGLPFESVLSIAEDSTGRLWAVAQNGGLTRGGSAGWELVSATTNWPGGSATCVAADRQGGVWVGTSSQGLNHFRDGQWRAWRQADGLANDSIRSLMVATNGDVWVATAAPNRLQRLRDGKVLVLASASRLGPIRAMAEDASGTVWIGTSEGDLQRVRGATLVDEPAIREPVPLSIRCLLATPDGSLWIGYAGDGLGRFKAGKYKRLTTADGLTDDFVSQLLADDYGNLWITGNRGLSRAPLAELDAVMTGKRARVTARAYGRSDGLPALQPNRDNCPAFCRARDGRLWFAMRSGLLVVQPENIRDNPVPPPVQLEQVSVDDRPVAVYEPRSPLQNHSVDELLDLRPPAPPLRISPGQRKLEFKFAALSFASPENDQFRYRLNGFDQQWVEAGPVRYAKYPRLLAGKYEFQVLACNNAGVWSETGDRLALVVAPFFWETWWFRAGGGLAAALTAGGSVLLVARRQYRRNLRRLEARRRLEHERSRIARDIHDDLGASLTRITLLSQPARRGQEAADGAAANLEEIHATAQQLTHAMGEVVWAVNPEHDTFDGLATYLSNYAQSFLRVAGVRCRLEMPMQLPARTLSAEVRHNLFLAFKEALNNVAKHAQATEVRISLTPGTAGFVLLVEDNGRGLPPVPGRGNGLANMRSRLEEIGGNCAWRSDPGAGTKVIFTVPLTKKYDPV